ncbi:MAG: family 10 glycosylhydrolase, partial [Leptolyngbya sp. SIO3F4]|nr:family 10 glycosylhydrolase [Leptolyngbya sp. SIO3F4]
MRSKFGRYALLGGLICFWVSWASVSAHAVADWQQQPCAMALSQRQILVADHVRYGGQPISQQQFATSVLKAFPGKFAAANEALGLTFKGNTEAEQLLMAALGDAAGGQRNILRSQSLAVLTTGAALPYQVDATRLLKATFRDNTLISTDYREGIAAVLAQGIIPATVSIPGLKPRLNPNRSESYQMAANLLCAASTDQTVAALVSQRIQPASLGARPIPEQEIRGAWLTNIDSEVLFARDSLEAGLRRLASLNFNTVYPTVWNWGYTLYPSAVAQRTFGYKQGLYPDLDDTGERNETLEAAQGNRDMLLELIGLAQPLGLRVIPWFEFGFMAPADSALARSHPEWLTQQADGSTIKAEGTHNRVWLNPFHPEVQKFMLDMVSELVANYPIDGFQVDDHFGLPVAYGYDPYTVDLYRQEHNGQAPPA